MSHRSMAGKGRENSFKTGKTCGRKRGDFLLHFDQPTYTFDIVTSISVFFLDYPFIEIIDIAVGTVKDWLFKNKGKVNY